MINGLRRRFAVKEERGAALIWVAGSLVMLLAFSALAVDLAWLYLSSSRLQNAADASALAAVVNAPGFMGVAQTDAESAATANGFPVGGANTVLAELVPGSDNRVQATLTTNVPTYFLKVLGFNSFDLTRRSTALYVKPVPLGSPDSCFGRDPTGSQGCNTANPNFWAAISAPYTLKQDGDPFSTNCLVNNNPPSSCNSGNVEYQRGGSYGGYYYGIEVGPGTTDLQIKVYDAGWYERPNYPNVETADARYSPGGGGNPGVTTHYEVHQVDTTPNDPTDNQAIGGCRWTIPPGANPLTYRNQWRTLCTLNGPVTEGIYVLHIWTTGNGSGTNQYSLAATRSGGPQPRVYGINDMSIFSNNLSGPSKLWLAQIDPIHAGKRLELRFFDAGDAQGQSFMRVRMPDGSIPSCTWFSEDAAGNQTGSGSGSCEWETTLPGGVRVFNNEWITATIDIANSYSCGADCFWWMELDLSQPNERTTWTARVIGNPVRLVPNP
jgi:Flp pilus assembly protein TadG